MASAEDEKKLSWADETDAEEKGQGNGSAAAEDAVAATPPEEPPVTDAPPPGLEPPPGFEDVADSLASVKVSDGVVDEADLTLKSHQGLQDPETEIKTISAGETPYISASTFEELGLSPEMLQSLYTEMKFEKPSKIQAKTLPMILTSPFRNMIAQAHNGSGKTTCFVVSMLSRVDPSVKEPQALCVCPTRELAAQNLAVAERIGKYTGLSMTSTAADDVQSRRSKINDQVIFATHGKLKGWIGRRMMPIRNIRILVFDEADEMFKADGFADDSMRMLKELRRANPNMQVLLFSATFNERVKRFATKILPDANQVFVPKEELSLDVIKQYRVYCPRTEDKTFVLKEMIFPQCEKLGQTIIFVRTRERARQLHSEMEKEGHKCTSIQGNMEFEARDRVVKEFRDGTTKILIATDVLSRGFDVTQVTLVINYDVPVERNGQTPAFDTYLHRIGRSGRFGRKGAAFNLITGEQERAQLDQIQEYFQHTIPEVPHNDEDRFVEVLKEAGLTDG